MELRATETEFCWTVRRRRYWRTCRRKYFLHYYASQGGFDPYAPRSARELYAVKKGISLDSYVRRLVNLAIRECFYAPVDEEMPETPPELFPVAAHRAGWEFQQMLEGKTPLVLWELLQGDSSPAAIHREMMEKLDAFCNQVTCNAWETLAAIPPCDRRPVASPLALAIAELKCYLVPVIAMRRAGEIWMLEGAGEADAGNEIAVLGKFAAAQLWGTPPQQVRSFILAGDDGVFTEVGADADVSEVLRGIRRDVGEMCQMIGDDGSVREEDFPADAKMCGSCVFRAFCRH